MIIDCVRYRDEYIEKLKKENLSGCNIVFIQVGDNQASNVYVRNKMALCENVGINAHHHKLPESISEEDLLTTIEIFNKDKSVHGLMVQLPLPKHISENKVINSIDYRKDIDGFTNINKGKLIIGDDSGIVPCTPAGVMSIISEQNIDLNGKNVVIVGRSNIVGKPLSQLMINAGATVTACNSKTNKDILLNYIANADIFISAIGQANYFNQDFCRWILNRNLKKCFAVDVGINKDENGKLCGDIDRAMYDYFGMVTPVPRGIGVLTVLNLVLNSIKCYKNIKNN